MGNFMSFYSKIVTVFRSEKELVILYFSVKTVNLTVPEFSVTAHI